MDVRRRFGPLKTKHCILVQVPSDLAQLQCETRIPATASPKPGEPAALRARLIELACVYRWPPALTDEPRGRPPRAPEPRKSKRAWDGHQNQGNCPAGDAQRAPLPSQGEAARTSTATTEGNVSIPGTRAGAGSAGLSYRPPRTKVSRVPNHARAGISPPARFYILLE